MNNVILINESVAKSWMRDASTFCLAVACFWPGWYFGWRSMTVFGVLVFIIILGKAVFKVGNTGMTIDEARTRLDEIEANQ